MGFAQQPNAPQAEPQQQQSSPDGQEQQKKDSSAPVPGAAGGANDSSNMPQPAGGTELPKDSSGAAKDPAAQAGAAGPATGTTSEGDKGNATPSPASQAGAGGQQNAAPPEQGNAAMAPPVDASKQQPKRILGIMPNYRAVSAGEIPPPPTAKQAFKVATQNSFDYSSFVFAGVTSAMAEGTDAHPQLGTGMNGFGRYYWRGFVDKTDGNYLVIFALPTVFHQDERYFAMGEGSFWKRAGYSSTRVLITPNYHGHNSFNFSEVLGRGLAQVISREYYPTKDRTVGALAVKYGYAIARDSVTNVFREFWPDIATHVLHRHP